MTIFNMTNIQEMNKKDKDWEGYVEAFHFGVLLIHHLMDSTISFWFKRAIFHAIYAFIGSQHLKTTLYLA